MGENFPETMSAEAMASLPMISGRHPQGGPDLPVHPSEANPRTLKWKQTIFSYKVVALIFTWEWNPCPSAIIDFSTFCFVIPHAYNAF